MFPSLAAFRYTLLSLTRSATGPLRHRECSEQKGESGAGYGGASLCGTSGPPTQSPPCPSSVPHTKASFSGGPELISAFFPLPQLPSPSQLLQYLHRDVNALPNSWCWWPLLILGALAVILDLLGCSSWKKYFSNQGLSLGTVPGR